MSNNQEENFKNEFSPVLGKNMLSSDEQFREVLVELSGLLGVKDTEALLQTGNLKLNEVDFTFVPPVMVYPDLMFILCDLGPLANTDEKNCFKEMLKVNFFMFNNCGPQMAINPLND